jgi:hypothetical protein
VPEHVRRRFLMSDVMTLAEIETAYPCEWVLMVNLQKDQHKQILSGQVIFHSKDRDEVYKRALALPIPRHIAVLYTGPVPAPGMETLLGLSGSMHSKV